jgi:hypothetical protein
VNPGNPNALAMALAFFLILLERLRKQRRFGAFAR